MPFFDRPGTPKLFFRVDDFTDPWRPAPYVLLLHGLGRSGAVWRAWAPLLGGGRKLLRPDLRGFGSSSREFDTAAMRLGDVAADLVALLNHLGLRRVHVCGEGAGAAVGVALATGFPDRVASLALIGAGADGGAPPAGLDQDLRRWGASEMAKADPVVMAAWQRCLAGWEVEQALRQLPSGLAVTRLEAGAPWPQLSRAATSAAMLVAFLEAAGGLRSSL